MAANVTSASAASTDATANAAVKLYSLYRISTCSKILGISNQIGLSDLFLSDDSPTAEKIQETAITNLSALTTGELPSNPSELLGSEKTVQILSEIKNTFDLVILDTPPVMAVTDSAVVSQKVDGVVVVVKPGETQMAVARQTVDFLRRGEAKILGVVLNDVELKRSHYAYYRGYEYATRKYREDQGDSTGLKSSFWRRRTK